MTLKIGSIEIPGMSGFDLRQTYEEEKAETLLRAKSGAGILQQRWKKLQSTISGNGWLPVAIDAIDTNAALAVSCIAPLAVYGASTSITLPRSYRTDEDYAPQGIALVNGEAVNTSISLAGQVATLGAVAGASQYQVIYVPILTGFVSISRDHDASSGLAAWSISVQEQ